MRSLDKKNERYRFTETILMTHSDHNGSDMGLIMVWPPRSRNVTYMQQFAVGHCERENLSSLLTAVVLQEGGTLPGPETGLLSNTQK